MLDRLAALAADDLADDVVPGLVVVQGDGRAAPVVEPLVSQESMAARTGKKSRPISVSRYSYRGGLSW